MNMQELTVRPFGLARAHLPSLAFVVPTGSMGLNGKSLNYVACPDSAAFTRAGVNGALRNLAPVASNTALPSAAATAVAAASPAPSGRS